MLLPSEKIFKKKKDIKPAGYREAYQWVHSKLFVNDCKPLLEELDNHIKEKISILHYQMSEALKFLSPDKLYKKAKSTHNICILKQEDLEKMRR
jgi:hypothetical protein